jgi:nucleoside-diphosphate-sugar epimerase
MKFVITGATSFIGLELIDYLLAHNHSVVAVCRQDSKGLSFIPHEVEIVVSKMCDYGRLCDAIPKADVFVNLAWGGTGHDGRNVVDIQNENITYTIAAMHAAGKMGCKVFVEAGSQAEYGATTEPQTEDSNCNPFSEYGKAKLKVKQELFNLSEQLDIKYIHLRIFSLFGEKDHPWTLIMSAVDKMLKNEQLDLSPCTQNWNFLYVKDAVRMITILCENAVDNISFKHEVYNIASDDTRQLKEFVERIKFLTGSSSILNYGANIPQNYVSLQPNIRKTIDAIGFTEFHNFDDVICRIVKLNRRKND